MSISLNKNVYSLFLSTLFFAASLQAAVELNEGVANPNSIQIVPVPPSPSANDIALRIQYPKKGSIEKKQPVHVEVRVDWFPLGIQTDLPRKNEIYDDDMGQSIHVFIDDHDYFELNEALFDAVDDHDEFFDQIAEMDVPFTLEPGAHIIRAFPCRSFGESLKSAKNFISSVFYIQKKGPIAMDLKKPFLTYNEPQGTYKDASKPILLDFYINNCALSKDGYKVRVTIDGLNQRFLYDWTPYYIYGLPKGSHTIRLELFSPQNVPIPGSFNHVEKKIFIE
ncbi:MAG: hypothetical protein V4489_02405 [Chlamydiota bacterium]